MYVSSSNRYSYQKFELALKLFAATSVTNAAGHVKRHAHSFNKELLYLQLTSINCLQRCILMYLISFDALRPDKLC